MSHEQEGPVPEISAIRIRRQEGTIIFVVEANDQPVAQLALPGGPVLGTIAFQSETPTPEGATVPIRASATSLTPEQQEAQRTVTLSGKLKTKPQPGKLDRSGKPTAWARFAAHVDGEREAHFYIATFHRHTRQIALGLAKEAAITVEGYTHPSGDPAGKRLDTFSIFNIVSYPGKARSGKER